MDTKIGILGGGQLGKMLIQSGSRLGLDITLMDKSKDSPGGLVCPSFVTGDITDHDNVINFGRAHDVCLLYTSPSPRDRQKSRMPSSA